MKRKSKEIANRLENLHAHDVIGASRSCLPKLAKIRTLGIKSHLSASDEEILRRFIELLALSLGAPYETESLIMLADIEVIRDAFSCIRKSVTLLREHGDEELECEEDDLNFFVQYALYCLKRPQ